MSSQQIFTVSIRKRIMNAIIKFGDNNPNTRRQYAKFFISNIDEMCLKLGAPNRNVYYKSKYLSERLERY